MKSAILLLAFSAAVFSSCTTAYKTGQTPDDVYFSPAQPAQDEYVQQEKKDNRRYRNDQDYYDDRYLRMKVQNRMMWSELDDWYYYSNRYNYSSYSNWNNPWSPSAYWNYYYNPYCYSCCVVGGTKNSLAIGKPRVFNLNSYNNSLLTNNNYNNGKFGLSNGTPRINTNTNTHRTNGNFLRDLFSNNNNNSNNSSNNSSSSPRTSSSSSSSSGSSSSGSAPVRRF